MEIEICWLELVWKLPACRRGRLIWKLFFT